MSLKNANKVDTNRVELEIEVDADRFEAAVNDAYKKNVRKMNIPGFRKGKAPRHLVEKLYGTGVFYEDAVNAAVDRIYETFGRIDGLINCAGINIIRTSQSPHSIIEGISANR